VTTPGPLQQGGVTKGPTGVDRVVARSQIIEVLHEYANMAVEQADFAGMSRLFHDDGRFVLTTGTAVPSNEIHRVVGGNEPTFIRHHITTIKIGFTSDTTAQTDSYFIAFTDLATPDHWGRWRDGFRRGADGRWLLIRKEPVIEGFAPDSWVATVLLPALADAPV
jgi:ketosteroid isomerase-like protein